MSSIFVHGRVDLGDLPREVQGRLGSVAGIWLEYDPDIAAIVVRHVQPAKAPILATTVSELVSLLDGIPYDSQRRIPGGDLYVHTEDSDQLVRLRVAEGGALHVQWAHPGYEGATKRPYSDGHEIAIEPWAQRLNGRIELSAAQPAEDAAALQELADTFEGLYPEGDFHATAGSDGRVRVLLADVNLDARMLVERLVEIAESRSLSGWLDVSSFDAADPEHLVRFLFKKGEVWVQHPLLWSDAPASA